MFCKVIGAAGAILSLRQSIFLFGSFPDVSDGPNIRNVDMRQEFDDDDSSFENNDYDLGDNVMVESELQDDYSVKDADEGFDDDLDEDAGPTADDLAAIESDSFDD